MQLIATRTLTARLAAPVLTATPAGTTQINLTWTQPTPTGQSVIAGRRLYRATSASGPWTEIPSSGTAASATGLTNGTRYYFYVEYYDQYGAGLPSPVVSQLPTPLTVGQKKWDPGWIILLDNFADNTTIRGQHLNPTFSQAQNTGHIIETASMPNVKAIKLLCYWGTVEKGETLATSFYDWSIIDQYVQRCADAGKALFLSIFPITFNTGVSAATANGGRFFPRYISNNPTTYGITEAIAGLGWIARTWRPSVNGRLIALHQAIAERYDDNPAFYGVQTEETAVNLSDGMDGFTVASYQSALMDQFDAYSEAFVRSQVRCSTNYFNPGGSQGDINGQALLARAALRGVGCGGPDVLPKEVVAANRIYSGYTGGVDYRGAGPYGPGMGGANRMPWYSEIQLPEMGSGKEGDFSMMQFYRSALYGESYAAGSNGPGAAIIPPLAGMRPMNPNHFVLYRNTTPPPAGETYRLNWYTDCKPFVNANIGYGSNVYPLSQAA